MADVSAVFFVFIAEQTLVDCLIRRRISGLCQDKQVTRPFQAVLLRGRHRRKSVEGCITHLPLRQNLHLFFCSEMGKERLDIFCAEKPRMRFTAEVSDITKNPLTIGLLCAICVMVISKDLSNLVHQFEIRIGTELQLIIFHGFPLISQ